MSTTALPFACVLKHGEFSIRVESQDWETLEWLVEFLGPNFVVDENTSCRWKVLFDVSPLTPAELLLLTPTASDPVERLVDFLSLDGAYQQFRQVAQISSQAIYADVRNELLVKLDIARGEIELRAKDTSSSTTRFYLMKVVREFAGISAITAGWIPLHAAAVELEGRGIVLAGPKRAGKSTEMLAALTFEQATFISNDRVYLGADTVSLLARGLPTVLNLRADTLALFPTLVTTLAERGYAAAKVSSSCIPVSNFWDEVSTVGHRSLSGSQLLAAVGAPGKESTPLRAIVFLEPAPASSKRFTRISAALATQLIRKNLLCKPEQGGIPEAFLGAAARMLEIPEYLPERVPFAATIQRVADEIPCFLYPVARTTGQAEELDREFWSVLRQELPGPLQ